MCKLIGEGGNRIPKTHRHHPRRIHLRLSYHPVLPKPLEKPHYIPIYASSTFFVHPFPSPLLTSSSGGLSLSSFDIDLLIHSPNFVLFGSIVPSEVRTIVSGRSREPTKAASGDPDIKTPLCMILFA